MIALFIKFLFNFIIFDFTRYKDIVCFTVVLADVNVLCFHASVTMVPFLMQKTYAKLLRRFQRAEQLIHSLNIAQKQNPSRFCCYTLVTLSLITAVSKFYFTFFILEVTPLSAVASLIGYSRFLVFILHLLSLLFVVQSKLTAINWHLDYLNNKVPVYLTPSEAQLFIDNKTNAKEVATNFVSFETADIGLRCMTARNIKTFNQIHYLLYSSCNQITKYFSLQMLFTVSALTLQTIKLFIRIINLNLLHNPISAANVIFPVFNFACVFAIADVFHKIKTEVRTSEGCLINK